MNEKMKKIRHWYIQKPIANNCPLPEGGAVFQEYMPTVVQQKCEWIRVYSADDIQAAVGMGLTRYSTIMQLLEQAREALEKLNEETKVFLSVSLKCHFPDAREASANADRALAAIREVVGGE